MKNDKKVLMAHGSGGRLSRSLVEGVFARAFKSPLLKPLNDQAIFHTPRSRAAFTTDSYVIRPIFFPGGDIGKLSICGTINDLVVGGARPLYLSASFIIEEGFAFDELERVVESMARTAEEAGVEIVTGDTKVVERGKGDSIYINTAGVGEMEEDSLSLSPEKILPGDAVIVSGTMGDHGMAIMASRADMRMEIPVESDCAPLYGLAQVVLKASKNVRAMRDPTRGGLATVLNEFASSAGVAITISEDAVPIKESVRGACEILGFDPLYVANEGKLVAVVSRDDADNVVGAMRRHPLGKDAAVIGHVYDGPAGRVLIDTAVGNTRALDMLAGDQLPRIC
jgi:hydrogenase expression/formation protein HypE